jgi:hypothetical protein
MRIEMVRTGDRYFAEVERDDSAVVRLRGPGAHELPHDLVHHVVEAELAIDRGENVGKVEYVRAPSRRPRPLKHAPRGKGGDIEAIVGLVHRIHRTRVERTPASDDLGRRWALRNDGRLVLDWPPRAARV